MTGILPLVYPGILAGILLTGIHAYLGIKIVKRGVIFAGLALAQFAALGSIAAQVAGYGLHSGLTYAWSATFAIGAAAIVAALRTPPDPRVPRDGVIAVLYVVAAALTVALSVRVPVHEIPVNILTVSLHTVVKTAILYVPVVAFLFAFHGRLDSGSRVWDFLFYVAVAIVVTASVAIAGVLVVFAYLLIPAVASVRMTTGWALGAIATCIGIPIAFKADIPTDATIVCILGLALGLLALVRVFTRPIADSR